MVVASPVAVLLVVLYSGIMFPDAEFPAIFFFMMSAVVLGCVEKGAEVACYCRRNPETLACGRSRVGDIHGKEGLKPLDEGRLGLRPTGIVR